MAADCTATWNLGCFPCSQPGVALPFNAPVTGTYTATWCYGGNEFCTKWGAVEGEPMVVPVGGLNEDYRHKFSITDPNGDRLSYDDGTREYDCFTFKLQLPGPNAPAFDVTVISCADLAGLNDEQVACVVDTLDFEDDDVFALLSPEQKAALTARLCSGTEVAYIVQTYASIASAQADTGTTVPVGQAIVVAGRLYQGTGSNAADLVNAGVFNPAFTEDGSNTLLTTVDGIPASVQIQAP